MAVAPPQGHTAENFNVTGQGKVQIGDIYNYSSSREEQDCLQSLCPTGIGYESQKDQNPERVPGTCLWTLKNPKYIEWRNDDAKKLLWISADPGCGKSVLARCIIDDLQQAFQNDSSKRVLYYFFKDTSAEQRSATRALSAILHQLFKSQAQLIRHALPSYREMGPALSTTFSKLWSIFTEAAVDRSAGNVICVFDALDECNEQEQPTLIKALEDFCLHQQALFSTSRLKFLVTSRPYFTIRREFDELLGASSNIELAGNDESASIKKEIDIVIKRRVRDLARENRLAKKVEDHLEKRLLETEHRTYLWLRLLWEIIRKNLSGTITEMNELIDNLPAGIQESYEMLLQRCPEPRFARKVLQIVLVAGRPLMLKEMDVALKVNEQTSSYADLELEEPSRLLETLPSRCGLMISIIQSKVYFIHQTVKEFLLRKIDIKAPDERTWQQSFSLEESHHLMAEICLRSMAFSEIELSRAHIWNALLPELDRDMSPNEYCRTHVYLSYTAIYWADHYRNTNNCKSVKILEGFLKTSRCHSVFGNYDVDYGTVLIAASAKGHENVVQILMDAGADLNAQGGFYGNVLQAASAKGHEKVVQILIDAGADLNAQGGWFGNALQAASAEGHDEVVQILIDAGADLNARGGLYGNALQAASAEGHDEAVQILIDAGADLNTQGGFYGNALQAASAGGHEKVVQILMEAGADLNAQGGWFGNALQVASADGHDEVVQILIDAGADLNAQGGEYGSALLAASAEGHDEAVQILIDAGADLNAQGGFYGNALQAASTNGHGKVVQILIDAGADLNARGGLYGNALQAASAGAHGKVVQMLLAAGVGEPSVRSESRERRDKKRKFSNSP
ncbi:hypothetical protein MMC22_007293 [Lobaria immixta]|nr:hypothetical protein [Lobaria immixta]